MKTTFQNLPISFSDVEKASRRISDLVKRTRIARCKELEQELGAKLYFKCENEQSMGAFKIRGAFNKLLSLSDDEAARGVVTHSSGNHAQAVALAASELGIESHIVIPRNAPKIKIERTKEFGGKVYLCDSTAIARQKGADDLISQHAYVFVPPYNDWAIIAGQGTATLELWEDCGPLDLVMCPVGGGGLASGAAIVTKALGSKAYMLGVEPEGASDAKQSLETGKIVTLDKPETIADGLRGSLGEKTFSVLSSLVDEIVTVGDEEIVNAMAYADRHMGLRLEPSGAVCLAALISKKLDVKDKRVGIVISGGNIDDEHFENLIR